MAASCPYQLLTTQSRITNFIIPTSLLISFFNDTPTTEIYTLSLHDALPIWSMSTVALCRLSLSRGVPCRSPSRKDRKSTRLNSSHVEISYAVFCLKKKTQSSTHHCNPPAPSLTGSAWRCYILTIFSPGGCPS